MSTRTTSDLAETLRNILTSPNVTDSNGEAANLVDVLDDLARAAWHGMKWCDQLTPMEAIENHGASVKDAADTIASAISDLAAAIREHHQNQSIG